MDSEFWENPEKHISPSNPSEMPSGQQNPYLTLFARIDVSLNGLGEELSTVDGVKLAPFESYHLTVKTLGEIPDADVREVVDAVSETLAKQEAFEVSLRGVSMFPNCLYIPTVDAAELLELHTNLCQLPQLEVTTYEGESYTPHMTIAKFTSRDIDGEEVYNILSQYQEKEWGTPTIERLHLVKDTPDASPSIFPSFEVLKEFELQNS